MSKNPGWKKLFTRIRKQSSRIEEEIFEIPSEIKKTTHEIGNNIQENFDEVVEYLEYQEKRWAKIGYTLIKKIFGPLVRKIWIENIEGKENIPQKGACIIASNHESYFDFVCFIAGSPRKIHYLAAEKFFQSKLWRPIMKMTGQIKVDRSSKDKTEANQLVLSALGQERMIGIFPEGTRSPDGKMQKAYTGVAKFALKAKVPVVPVGIKGTYEIMSRHDKRPKLKKAKIIIGEPLYFDEHYGKEEDRVILRKITDQIMLKIAELSGKEYPHIEKNGE